MGLFDNLRCALPLPGASALAQSCNFQTKDLDCAMDQFEIRSDGSIWHEAYDTRIEKTEESFFGLFIHRDNPRWEPYEHTGELRFYEYISESEEVEFIAFYLRGALQGLHCLRATGRFACEPAPVEAAAVESN